MKEGGAVDSSKPVKTTKSKLPAFKKQSSKATQSDESEEPGEEMESHDMRASSNLKLLIVDCRLDMIQQEVSIPNSVQFELFAASKAHHIKKQVSRFLEFKDDYHLCLLGLDTSEDLEDHKQLKTS